MLCAGSLARVLSNRKRARARSGAPSESGGSSQVTRVVRVRSVSGRACRRRRAATAPSEVGRGRGGGRKAISRGRSATQAPSGAGGLSGSEVGSGRWRRALRRQVRGAGKSGAIPRRKSQVPVGLPARSATALATATHGTCWSPVMRRRAHMAWRAVMWASHGMAPKPPSDGRPRRNWPRATGNRCVAVSDSGGRPRPMRRVVQSCSRVRRCAGGRPQCSAW